MVNDPETSTGTEAEAEGEFTQQTHDLSHPGDVPKWTLRFETAAGVPTSTTADGLDGVEPAAPVGESLDLRFIFRSSASSPNTTFQGRYEAVLEHSLAAAGEYSVFDGDRRTLFTETNSADEPAPILGIDPGYQTPTTGGYWTLIDAVESETQFSWDACILSVTVTVIAPITAHATITDLRSALSYSAF